MTVHNLSEIKEFNIIVPGDEAREIKEIFCCDLLSVAMGQCPADGAWITVVANMNTLAVASLADASCIIFSENTEVPEATINKALAENITLIKTKLPSFVAGLKIHELIRV